ncbi:virulence factor [Lichenihabitans psoromatis]|uniref:virulence factor n=1 Tax=Lichenihabitans psoromatis TaxID=2528642 RepID=UPI0010361F11|nr:virulence factor [Lichenihabitans psoromatis]
MADLYVLSWRDIPAQVIVRDGLRTITRDLPKRFSDAIGRAASREGPAGIDDDPSQWRESAARRCSDDLEAAARDAIDEIERNYDGKMLAELSAAAGHSRPLTLR